MGGLVKTRWDLVPWSAARTVAEVLTFGAIKHGDVAWRSQADPESIYFAKAMRHLIAWRTGSKNDSESGLPHLAHAACNLLFLLDRTSHK